VIHLDTTFIVDLLRELRRDRFGPASSYLEALDEDEELGVSVHVVCELMAGACSPGAPRGEMARLAKLCDGLHVRYPGEQFAAQYGRLLAHLHAAGEPIDSMDLLIGTAAVLDDARLVTRNARHFVRIPGLQVDGY
jgi:tRNA(fMet)-specific endonuclease VapC